MGYTLPGRVRTCAGLSLPGARGSGVGGVLMRQAMDFCDARGYRRTYLWTFEGLNAARRLYERHGFQLVHQARGTQWGTEVNEQRFERVR